MIQNYTYALPDELILQLNGEKYGTRTRYTKFPIIVLYVSCFVCQEGFKPSISGATNLRFNQLSY